MKKLYATLLAAMLAVIPALHGCKDADMEAELAARNARLDELEKQDQKIRDILYGKINALRGKLLPIIEKVEADLKKRIDNESDKIIHVLEENVQGMIKTIDDGFAQTQSYIDKNMQGCYDDINDSFTALFECKQAVEDGLRKAIKDHNSNLEALLRKYEKQIDAIMGRAEAFESSLKKLESKIKGAEEIDAAMDQYHSSCSDLQDEYEEMEQNEAKLLESMGKAVSQEYLASLEIDRINELQELLSAAEIMVDDLESFRNDIETSVSDSEGLLSDIISLSDLAEGDLLDLLIAAVDDGGSMRDMADELQIFISDFDADEYLDGIEDMLSSLEEAYDDANDAVEYLNDIIDGMKDNAYAFCDEVSSYIGTAQDKSVEAIEFYNELSPYLNH